MADDDSKLTRRRVLGGLATVGAAAAVGGAGTWAAFSDQEGSTDNYVQAGTRDMKFDGVSNGAETVTVEVTGVAPGDPAETKFSGLTNVGSLSGELAAEITSVTSGDGTSSEPEGEVDSDTSSTGGELDDYLDVEIGFSRDQSRSSGDDVAISMQNINNANSAGKKGTGHVLGASGSSNDSSNLFISYQIDSSAGNAAQGDRVTFDVAVYLEEASQTANS